MFRWLFAVVGTIAGFVASIGVLGVLETRFKIDVMHVYIIPPTPPPGGYRSILDVPPATWPMDAGIGIAILFGWAGARLGRRADRGLKVRRSANAQQTPGAAPDHSAPTEQSLGSRFCAQCGSQSASMEDDFCIDCGARLARRDTDTPRLVATSQPGVRISVGTVAAVDRTSEPRKGIQKVWDKSAMRFAIDMNGRARELTIIRTDYRTNSILLDGQPTGATLPVFFLTAKTVSLPDGSSLRVSPWGAFGPSVRRDGVKLKTLSKKPVLIVGLIVLVAALAGLAVGLSVWWLERPDWKKSDPPVWAFVAAGSSQDTRMRWFINTRAVWKDNDAHVRVLIRSQTIAPGEADEADVRKESDYTTVQNFTCNTRQQGYDLSAMLKGFSGKTPPDSIPPDSELPRAVAWSALTQIRPGMMMADAREAACYLAARQ